MGGWKQRESLIVAKFGGGGGGGAVGGGEGDGEGGTNVSQKNGSLGNWNDPSGDPSIDLSSDPCIRKSGGEKEERKREKSRVSGGDRDEERRILKETFSKGQRSISRIGSALTETRRQGDKQTGDSKRNFKEIFLKRSRCSSMIETEYGSA